LRGRRWICACVALVASLIAAGSAWASPPRPDSTTQPLKDGCQRNPGALLTKETPEWAYVYNTPASERPPAPQWVAGIVSSGNPRFQAVHTSGGDLPTGHDAYDFNVNILPDPQYAFLLGTANLAGQGEEAGRLHTEREDNTIPKFAWPEPGDRIMELGSWVWDCGHWGTPTNVFSPDYVLPHEGQPCPTPGPLGDPAQCTITGESTEFHPYRALWDVRSTPVTSPYGESQGDLFITTDKTRAGIEADCAHAHAPPPGDNATYGPDYRACLETEPNWQDPSGDYDFLLNAPPKPFPSAHMEFRVVDHGSTTNAPEPMLTQHGSDAVRVRFHIDTKTGERLVMGKTIYVGWTPLPPSALPTHVRITYRQLTIQRIMDPGCSLGAPIGSCSLESTRTNQLSTPPGDWNLYLDANGVWDQWQPGNGEFLPPSDGTVYQPSDKTTDFYLPQSSGWRLYVHGRECDLNDVEPDHPMADCPTNRELADDNDVPGLILDLFPSVASSLGDHSSNALTRGQDPTSTCPHANPMGCYTLDYRVDVIDDSAARAASEPR
jgi:hypothetical protein